MLVVLNNGQTARTAALECVRLDVHPTLAFVSGVYRGSAATRTEAPETVIRLVLDEWQDILKHLKRAPKRAEREAGFTVVRN